MLSAFLEKRFYTIALNSQERYILAIRRVFSARTGRQSKVYGLDSSVRAPGRGSPGSKTTPALGYSQNGGLALKIIQMTFDEHSTDYKNHNRG